MTALAFCLQGLVATVVMALLASKPPVVLVQSKGRHGVVVEAQVFPFPAVHAMALVTSGPKGALVRVLLLMAG